MRDSEGEVELQGRDPRLVQNLYRKPQRPLRIVLQGDLELDQIPELAEYLDVHLSIYERWTETTTPSAPLSFAHPSPPSPPKKTLPVGESRGLKRLQGPLLPYPS